MTIPSFPSTADVPDNFRVEDSWKHAINEEFSKEYFRGLKRFLDTEYLNNRTLFPPADKIFAAFNRTPFTNLKVVILGQDPYHGDGQANGLCFSVADGIRKPPSLVNIFKELNEDIGMEIPENGNLEPWADQGVLLLNATLTVRAHEAGSHQGKGWEEFTDAVVQKISDQLEGIVFLLWGNYAQKKGQKIDRSKHMVLEAPHPSPLARGGFKGCKHFSKTNEYLLAIGKTPIDWNLNRKKS
jgi:uracil-DNA glycosylase